MSTYQNTYKILHQIYEKHRRKYKENSDSKQMCCMWSTSRPPDDIYNTDQIFSIDEAFKIELSEDDVLELYDMDIVEAAEKIDMVVAAQS